MQRRNINVQEVHLQLDVLLLLFSVIKFFGNHNFKKMFRSTTFYAVQKCQTGKG